MGAPIDGAMRTENGTTQYWDEQEFEWISLEEFTRRRNLDSLDYFNESDFSTCFLDIYSENCLPKMFKTFATAPYNPGADLIAKLWAENGTAFEVLILVFSWPLWFGLWIFIAVVIWLDP